MPQQNKAIDPVALTAELIRCPSVTPEEGGRGACGKIPLRGRFRLHAGRPQRHRQSLCPLGEKGAARSFGFNGHTDVVPVGDTAGWTTDPFGAEMREGYLWGRGATDMKSGVAAFAAAAIDFRAQRAARRRGDPRHHGRRGGRCTGRHSRTA